MVNSGKFKKAVGLINKSQNILVTTHTKPDGDACGCVAAVCHTLKALRKKALAVLPTELPEWYAFLFDKKPAVFGRDITAEQLGGIDLIVLVDVNSYSQLPEIEKFLKQNQKPVLVIDHHPPTDGLGDVELVDVTAAAGGLIVLDFLKYVKQPITKKIARALFVAIAADTGWFQFSNTDSRVYRSCAELVDAGAKPTQIYHALYHNFSLQRFKLMAAMLSTLELHFNGRYAEQHLLQRDFSQTGASYRDTENFIDECRRISTVEAAALFVELQDGRIKCSMRSTDRVDVRRIAEKFGGGGHKMAAGTHLPPPLETARQTIKAEVEKQLNK